MSYRPSYTKGSWKAVCDVCGREFLAQDLLTRWDGLKVCEQDFEHRQPQDFVRGVPDIQAPPWTRPESTDTFAYFACSTRTSIAGSAIAGCMIAGNATDVGVVPPSSFS